MIFPMAGASRPEVWSIKNFWKITCDRRVSLDGSVKSVRGALPVAMAAKKEKIRGVILPQANASEAAVVREIEVLGVSDLPQVVQFLNGNHPLDRSTVNLEEIFSHHSRYPSDFNDVKGSSM